MCQLWWVKGCLLKLLFAEALVCCVPLQGTAPTMRSWRRPRRQQTRSTRRAWRRGATAPRCTSSPTASPSAGCRTLKVRARLRQQQLLFPLSSPRWPRVPHIALPRHRQAPPLRSKVRRCSFMGVQEEPRSQLSFLLPPCLRRPRAGDHLNLAVHSAESLDILAAADFDSVANNTQPAVSNLGGLSNLGLSNFGASAGGCCRRWHGHCCACGGRRLGPQHNPHHG